MSAKCKDCRVEGVGTRRPAPHPGPRCASHHREFKRAQKDRSHGNHLEATYGITSAEYEAIKEFQGGVCAICARSNGATKRLAVDHSHSEGWVRGLLCGPCNKDVLGWLREDPEAFQRAIDYIKSPPAFSVIGERKVPGAG